MAAGTLPAQPRITTGVATGHLREQLELRGEVGLESLWRPPPGPLPLACLAWCADRGQVLNPSREGGAGMGVSADTSAPLWLLSQAGRPRPKVSVTMSSPETGSRLGVKPSLLVLGHLPVKRRRVAAVD